MARPCIRHALRFPPHSLRILIHDFMAVAILSTPMFRYADSGSLDFGGEAPQGVLSLTCLTASKISGDEEPNAINVKLATVGFQTRTKKCFRTPFTFVEARAHRQLWACAPLDLGITRSLPTGSARKPTDTGYQPVQSRARH